MKKQPNTIASFKAVHDPDTVVPNKIRDALASLLKEGAENWEYEADFIKRAGISQAQMATYRSRFDAHILMAPAGSSRSPKRVYVGDAKVAKRIRGE